MSEQEKNTEEIIFEAAQNVFIKKGFDGARMEEIAKEAGINKSLLHYYYRSKEKLFNAIFAKVFSLMIPKIFSFIESDMPFFQKIEFFVETYIDLILKNPYIPNFIISEINRNPENIGNILGDLTGIVKNDVFGKFSKMVENEVAAGNIRSIKPEQLLVNMLGMCIFPVMGRPIIQSVIFKNDKAAYKEFLESRKKEVADFIIHSIKVQK